MDFDTLNVRKINLGPPGKEVVLTVDTLRRMILSQSVAFHGGDPVQTKNAVPISLPVYTRVSLADMNAGKTLVPAVPGLGYSLIDVRTITIGADMAATAAATGIAVYGTQSGSAAKLFEVALAAGKRSIACIPGLTDTAILADGASFVRCDPNTAITCKAVSAGAFDLITSSYFDIQLWVTLS